MGDEILKELPKVLLVFFLGLSGSALGVGLLSWRDLALTGQGLSDCERRIEAVEKLAAAVATENSINSLARTDTKTLIERMVGQIERLRDDVFALKAQAQTQGGQGAFTDADGRELDRRIRKLEHPNP